jgi:hypothetical protein
MASRGVRQAPAGLDAVLADDLRHADAVVAVLGERHPQVPILVAAGQLPAADSEEDPPPVERAQRPVILVGELPRVEPG